MKDLVIARHNAASRLILRYVLKGDLGATVAQAHVGTDDLMTPVTRNVPSRFPLPLPTSTAMPLPDISPENR